MQVFTYSKKTTFFSWEKSVWNHKWIMESQPCKENFYSTSLLKTGSATWRAVSRWFWIFSGMETQQCLLASCSKSIIYTVKMNTFFLSFKENFLFQFTPLSYCVSGHHWRKVCFCCLSCPKVWGFFADWITSSLSATPCISDALVP